MKFYSVTGETLDQEQLKTEFGKARAFGVVRAGETCLFFRSGLKEYFVPYHAIGRCFRRVQMVPARMCCGKGEFQIENLVVCVEEKEVAQIQLPGTRAAQALIEELKTKIPGCIFSK